MNDNTDTRIDVSGSCTEHIMWYAKGWYGRSEKGTMHDLAIILGEVTGTSTEYMSEDDVHRCLAYAWAEVSRALPQAVVNDATLEMLGWKWIGWNESFTRKPEDVLIGKLSIVSPRDVKWFPGCDGKGSGGKEELFKSRLVHVRFGDKVKELKEEVTA